jgi:3-keto-5-aminohexanoate cleavage enzyme
MGDDLVITVAPCGAETTRADNPAVPYTPEEIAAEVRRSFEAGARMVHVHARLDDGTPTQEEGRYRETVEAIRAAAPEIVIQVSTGGAVGMTQEERLGSLAARPEMASLTCGTVNFGRGVFENPAPLMLAFARALLEAGVRPELEIFDLGHLDNARWLAARAPLEGAQHHDLVLGVPGGAAGTPENVTLLAGRLPPGATWSATGIGRSHLPVVATAIACGGHVRLGFEDQVELSPGVLAPSNAALVERAARIGELLGRSVASPARAREILGLSPAELPRRRLTGLER